MADKDSELSQKVSDGLRRLGYSKERQELRARIYDNASEGVCLHHRRKYNESLDLVMTGSRREGIVGFWDSDTDQLVIPKHVVCVEEQHVKDIRENITVFQLDYKDVPEGYAYLKLHSIAERADCADIIKDDCFERDGELLLANNKIIADKINIDFNPDTCTGKRSFVSSTGFYNILVTEKKQPHGPSRPRALQVPVTGGKLDYDSVFGLRCHSHYLTDWCDSKHDKAWPSEEVVVRIRGLDTHVVPIGVEGTEGENLQWRVSHALGEIALVKSFNDIQIKVYCLMKMIGKEVLEDALNKHVRPSDTDTDYDVEVPGLSYIIKNVMFWISEEETQAGFTDELFTDRVLQALRRLLVIMETGFLPSYMFPTRNICTRKLTEEYRAVLVTELNILLSEGLGLVYRIPRLRDQVNTTDTQKLDRHAKRHQIREYLFLAIFAMPPERIADVHQRFRNATWTIKVVWIYFHEVWPCFLKIVTDDMFEDFDNRSSFRKFIHVVSEYIGLRMFYGNVKQWMHDLVERDVCL